VSSTAETEVPVSYVGPGRWFATDRRHMRIGYGWPLEAELTDGLASLSEAVREALDV
jgi:DNA-binding transcriptional MocR family regulator